MNHRPAPPHRSEFTGPAWLTLTQAAEALDLPVSVVHYHCQLRHMPAIQDRSKRWHIHHDVLDQVRAMDWYRTSMQRRRQRQRAGD